jgi:hypothetical protein
MANRRVYNIFSLKEEPLKSEKLIAEHEGLPTMAASC